MSEFGILLLDVAVFGIYLGVTITDIILYRKLAKRVENLENK